MKENIKSEIIEWIKTIAIALAVAFIITYFIRPTLVKGYSMYPTLEENDYLIINRIAYKRDVPDYGDVIVFKSHLTQENGKEKDLVKRVIGIPGDRVNITNSEVYVNDKLLDEPYINDAYTEGEIDVEIPENKVFVMGDNRTNSMDSRDESVGLVDINDIMGEVIVRLYPFDKIGKVE